MSTIREWLNRSGFDWYSGRIIYQPTEGAYSPGWGDPTGAEELTSDSEILDLDFHSGYGAPSCPRFVAKDMCAVYFPTQYDGATSIQRVLLNLDVYLEEWANYPTPYPGG